MTNAEQSPLDENQVPIDGSSSGSHLVSTPRSGEGQLGAMAPRVREFQETAGFNLREYWRILNKRKWLIGSIISTFLIVGWLQVLMAIPIYTSTTRIQVDSNVGKIVEGGNLEPTEYNDYEFLRTQYELLQSHSLAERVVSMARLGEDANFLKPRQFSILGMFRGADKALQAEKQLHGSSAERERAAAAIVLRNRSVRPVSGSRLIDITYSDPSPYDAMRIAASFAEAFIASNLDKRFQANSYAKAFLEDQVTQLKLRLEQSEKVLLDFAQKEQIVATQDKASIAETNLASASAALGSIIADRIKNEELWRQVQNSTAINLPQLLTNNVVVLVPE